MTDPFNLARFVDAQASTYETALRELTAGAKVSHWMWFVFPQLAGLGHSEMSRRYALRSRAEAAAYLAHPLLGPRLRECARVLLTHSGRSARDILGVPDDLKLHSCATLFAEIDGPDVFAELLERFFDGARDQTTLAILRAAAPGWITPAQREALATLLVAFHDLGLPYQATGGFAGNLHGSTWPLHDLDFDVADTALPALADRFRAHVVRGPAEYRDAEFALELLTLRFGAVEADIAAASSIRLIDPTGREHAAPTDLAAAVPRAFDGRMIPTMPLASLIAYKRIIGRDDDVADLERLSPLPAGAD